MSTYCDSRRPIDFSMKNHSLLVDLCKHPFPEQHGVNERCHRGDDADDRQHLSPSADAPASPGLPEQVNGAAYRQHPYGVKTQRFQKTVKICAHITSYGDDSRRQLHSLCFLYYYYITEKTLDSRSINLSRTMPTVRFCDY